MINPFAPILDQLQKQAEMRFSPADVARVHRICHEEVRGHNIDVELPLPAWDSTAMGVAFRQTKKQNVAGTMRSYKRTASFVLEQNELADEGTIRAKAGIARAVILQTVLCQIREVKEKDHGRAAGEGPSAPQGADG